MNKHTLLLLHKKLLDVYSLDVNRYGFKMLTEKQKYHDHNDQKMKLFYSIPWLELFLVGSLFTKFCVQGDL